MRAAARTASFSLTTLLILLLAVPAHGGNEKTIPADLRRVAVRAKCNVHGFGGREVMVDLSRKEGDGYRVQRIR